jgi:CheY-like chemotaxis protein
MPPLDATLATGQHLSALVVDDSMANRHILASLLESAGVGVITASGGLEALELARTRRPHVIFMDLKMSDLDGLEATRRLSRDPATAAIPVIAVTASALGDVRQTARDAGCVDYLSKPIRAQLLFGMLQTHLGVRLISGSEPRGSSAAEPAVGIDGGAEIASRLRQAIALGDVSDLQALARQLAAGESSAASMGERINRLAMNFDFDALRELAESLEAGRPF